MKINYVFTHEFKNIDVNEANSMNCATSCHYSENKINLFVCKTDIKDVELTVIV